MYASQAPLPPHLDELVRCLAALAALGAVAALALVLVGRHRCLDGWVVPNWAGCLGVGLTALRRDAGARLGVLPCGARTPFQADTLWLA